MNKTAINMVKKKRRKRMRYLCCFAFYVIGNIFFLPNLPAQVPQDIRFERITIEQGLSQNTVLVVLQDSKEFLWFGTEDGLNRFDGYTFKTYRHNPDDHSSISNNTVRAIYEDNSGIIWIGTHGGGLNSFDRKTGVFTRYPYQPAAPHGLNGDIVWTICGGAPGVLWIGTNKGLNRFDCTTGKFTHHWGHEPGNPNSLSDNMVKVLLKDGTGGFWIGTGEGGLDRLVFHDIEPTGGKEGTFTHYKHNPDTPGSLSHNRVHTLFLDRDGVLWVGTQNGLNRFDEGKDIFINYTGKYEHLSDETAPITSIAGEDGADVDILWIGTYGDGLYRFDRKKKKFFHYKYNPVQLTSLSSDSIQRIYVDNTGIMWVGTDSGLNKFDKKKQKFGHWKMKADTSNTSMNNTIWSIYTDREGVLLLGTASGLSWFDRKSNKVTPVKIGTGPHNKRQIHPIYEDSSGVLWIGVYEKGLYRLDREEETAGYCKHEGLRDNKINAVLEDAKGTLWIGTGKGLYNLDSRNDVLTCDNNIPGDTPVNTIYKDRSNFLWIGTERGLNLYRRDTGTFARWKNEPDNPHSLTNNKVSSIWEDESGVLWLGTWGGGLNRFDRDKNTFTHFLEKDGLPNEYIYGILGDDEGYLWMSTNKGISRFDPKSEIFKNYDYRDGLQSNEYNAGAYYKSEDGEMFFGGINGFNAFYPRKIKDNPHVPPIVITLFQIMNEPVGIGGDSPLKQAINETKEITLSYRDYFFSFEFSALDFSNPAKNKYKYKMEGLDQEWIQTDAKRRFATYTNLDPGEYVFRVQGANNDDLWNSEGTSIKIVITPPLWETWWFQVLAALAFAVFSYWLIGFIKKYIIFAGFWKREKYIGKFKLVGKIGSGGMGTIYRAKDTTQKIGTVALKVLKEELYIDDNYRKRFKQEAAIIDQLDHPNIVKVIERGQFEQKLFIAMELLRGTTLSNKIAREDEIDLKEIVDIIYQVSGALVKIHGKEIVHRDLKPDNIMLIEHKGNRNFVKLLDFGLAKTQHQTRITQTGTVLGTLNYMAPEQISDGRFSYASDVYSLGVIFYETLTKKIPFPGDNVSDIMRQILNDAPVEPILSRPDLTPGLNKLVLRMIAKTPESRPLAIEVLDELKEFRLVQTQFINKSD